MVEQTLLIFWTSLVHSVIDHMITYTSGVCWSFFMFLCFYLVGKVLQKLWHEVIPGPTPASHLLTLLSAFSTLTIMASAPLSLFTTSLLILLSQSFLFLRSMIYLIPNTLHLALHSIFRSPKKSVLWNFLLVYVFPTGVDLQWYKWN